ncbi:hypothetical protein LH51_00740 [Nitrincola sp. A-D6]|uniref:hypothetical protein n=1 Tax=Nitrincola sp. A-D6 TaxID=1545442 RepID=UPI00051FA424|nr:hypothetical protein [Nitrincola sp. A-D6]KGK43309.1 hypothetical protein LH51_00740 [Nitrincola sp. A-D6]
MKLRTNITINGKLHHKGDTIPWYAVYPFFLFHMLMFGGSGFFLAYADTDPDVAFLYMHGGLAIFVYIIFYLVIFGRDEVKWMFINAGLGLLGIYTQMGWILSVFDREISDYPIHVHVIPFLYFVLYSFLLRQAVLDISHSREDETKRQRADTSYTVILTLVYLISYFLTK